MLMIFQLRCYNAELYILRPLISSLRTEEQIFYVAVKLTDTRNGSVHLSHSP